MIDLFGMSQHPPKSDEALSDAAAAPPEEHSPARGSHRVWAFLLFLDAIFVILFGGALARIVYQYVQGPAPVAAPVAHRRAAPPPAKPAETAPAPAPAPPPPAPAKPLEPNPEPRIAVARHADSPRPPKPSMITEAPKPHTAPSLVGAGGAAASAPKPSAAPPAAAESGKTKAQPVIFKLRAPDAREVQLIGAFIVHGGRKEMAKGDDGIWSVKLYLNPGQYRYFFSVDRKKILDPDNPRADRGASVVGVP
jgi:hypothetical protein